MRGHLTRVQLHRHLIARREDAGKGSRRCNGSSGTDFVPTESFRRRSFAVVGGLSEPAFDNSLCPPLCEICERYRRTRFVE